MRPKKADVVYVSKDEIKDTPWERGLDILKTLGMRPVPTSAGRRHLMSVLDAELEFRHG